MSLRPVHLPDWPGDVRIFYSTRTEGHSEAPYCSFNVGNHVGDHPAAVHANRAALIDTLPAGTALSWLEQVHGCAVLEADPLTLRSGDAQWTRQRGLALAIMTADCLPILIAARHSPVIAAIHVGWRGLAAGIIEATLSTLPVPSDALCAWLGPAIGPTAFTVRGDVRDAVVAAYGEGARSYLARQEEEPGAYCADLRGLATLALRRGGVRLIGGEALCTHDNPELFYSHRRDGTTGRMASLILRVKP